MEGRHLDMTPQPLQVSWSWHCYSDTKSFQPAAWTWITRSGVHSVSDVMKSAYARSILIRQREDLRGRMYGVPCSALQIPEGEEVSVACYNSPCHVTLAVNSERGLRYLDKLQQQGSFLCQNIVSIVWNKSVVFGWSDDKQNVLLMGPKNFKLITFPCHNTFDRIIVMLLQQCKAHGCSNISSIKWFPKAQTPKNTNLKL